MSNTVRRPVRIVMLGVLLSTCLVALVWRLSVIQLKEHDRWAQASLEQSTISVSLADVSRGDFLDREGRPLTGATTEERVVIIPPLIENKAEVLRGLAEILGDDPETLAPALDDASCLTHKLASWQRAAIEAKRWAGVYVAPIKLRYQEGQPAAHVIGHLGPISSEEELDRLAGEGKPYRIGDVVGKSGLEEYYEQRLKALGAENAARCFVDARGRPLPGLGLVKTVNPDTRHSDVILTIDRSVQKIAEDVMDQHQVDGAAVVMDVGTGDILALASRPVFDPRYPGQALHEADSFINQATSLFQPGSVFKIVVAAAALEEGLVSTETPFMCTGLDEQLIACARDEGHGALSFAEAFAQSCNPTFAKTALQLGSEKLIAYARRLGLDNQRLLGCPYTPDLRQRLKTIGEPYNLVNASVGQGPVLVTPVQTAAMVSAIANGGVYHSPRLVKAIQDAQGQMTTINGDTGRRALAPETAHTLRGLMGLVTTAGNGREGYVRDVGSAGKTGTAEVGDDGRTNAWFAGYFPVDNPQLAIVILVRGAESGGKSAAPLFAEMAEAILGGVQH